MDMIVEIEKDDTSVTINDANTELDTMIFEEMSVNAVVVYPMSSQ